MKLVKVHPPRAQADLQNAWRCTESAFCSMESLPPNCRSKPGIADMKEGPAFPLPRKTF